MRQASLDHALDRQRREAGDGLESACFRPPALRRGSTELRVGRTAPPIFLRDRRRPVRADRVAVQRTVQRAYRHRGGVRLLL